MYNKKIQSFSFSSGEAGDSVKKIFPILFSFFLLNACSLQGKAILEEPEREFGWKEKESIPADFVPQTLHLTALGDSLTEGVGSGQGGYVYYFAQELLQLKGVSDVKTENFGVKGLKSAGLLEQLQKGGNDIEEALRRADLIVITIGGNDLMQVVKENFLHLTITPFLKTKIQYEENLRTILQKIRGTNSRATVLVFGLYNPFSYLLEEIPEMDQILARWNETIRGVAEDFAGTYFVEVADLFQRDISSLLYKDQFHPNDEGYRLIARRAFSFLEKDVEPTRDNGWFVKGEGTSEN